MHLDVLVERVVAAGVDAQPVLAERELADHALVRKWRLAEVLAVERDRRTDQIALNLDRAVELVGRE